MTTHDTTTNTASRPWRAQLAAADAARTTDGARTTDVAGPAQGDTTPTRTGQSTVWMRRISAVWWWLPELVGIASATTAGLMLPLAAGWPAPVTVTAAAVVDLVVAGRIAYTELGWARGRRAAAAPAPVDEPVEVDQAAKDGPSPAPSGSPAPAQRAEGVA